MQATAGRRKLRILAVVAAASVAVCVLMLVKSTQASAQTTAPPLLEYKFDEGSGYTATNTGTTGAALNGAIGSEVTYSNDSPSGNGYSLEFDGSGAWNSVDDRVDVPQAYSASGQPLRYYPGDSVTVEAWVKPDSTSVQRIVWDDYGNPGVLLTVLNGKVQFGVSTTTNGPAQGSLGAGAYGGTIEVGKWQHIAGVYDGNEVRACVDGEKKASSPAFGNIVNPEDYGPGSPGWIGVGADVFAGKIDDFRVFTRALPSDELPCADPAPPTPYPLRSTSATSPRRPPGPTVRR